MKLLLRGFSVLTFGLFSAFLYSMEAAQLKIKKEHDFDFPVFLNHQDPMVAALAALNEDKELLYCVLLDSRKIEASNLYRVFVLDGEFLYCGNPYELDPKGFIAYRFGKGSYKTLRNYELSKKGKILYLRALKNGGFKAGKRSLKVENDSFTAMVRAQKDRG